MASQGRGAVRKGKAFELRVAKALTPLLGVGELRRVHSQSFSDHDKVPGDICRADGGSMPLVIECKCQPFDLADCMNDNANVRGWAGQAEAHALASRIGEWAVVGSWKGHIAVIRPFAQMECYSQSGPQTSFATSMGWKS